MDDNSTLGNSGFFSQGQKVAVSSVLPSYIKSVGLSSDFIKNTTVATGGPISLSNGASLTLQSIISSLTNKNIVIGGVPYCVAFFQTSLSVSNIIGSGVTGSGYAIKGPLAMPSFSPNAVNSPLAYGGSDGHNVVFITELFNNTGSTQTIYYITNTRVIQSGGGAG